MRNIIDNSYSGLHQYMDGRFVEQWHTTYRAALSKFPPIWVLRLSDTAVELSTLGCSGIHSNTLQVLQRTALCPAPPNAVPEYVYPYCSHKLTDN